jgi:hypothetical protein
LSTPGRPRKQKMPEGTPFWSFSYTTLFYGMLCRMSLDLKRLEVRTTPVIFIYGLFNDHANSSESTAWNDWRQWVMNWKGYGSKLQLSNAIYCPGICL